MTDPDKPTLDQKPPQKIGCILHLLAVLKVEAKRQASISERRSMSKFKEVKGTLPGSEALLVRQNPVFPDQRAAAQMNIPENIEGIL